MNSSVYSEIHKEKKSNQILEEAEKLPAICQEMILATMRGMLFAKKVLEEQKTQVS